MKTLALLRLTVAVWAGVAPSTALQDAFRQEAIDRYLASRNGSDIACLYTFDRFRASVNVSGPRTYNATDQDAADDQLLVTIPPTFEEHVGVDCPFGDLQFDPGLVTNIRSANSTSEHGVHLSEDPQKDVKRPHIASNDVVPAKDFYTTATTTAKGFAFEFSYRRRVETNQTMTLFSIANRFGSCVDPGFRVDLISTHVIMVNYFVPVLIENDIGCYERRLFSARIERCVMPRYRPNVDDNPIVHVIVTLEPKFAGAALRTRFFLKYVDPVTMEVYECSGSDSAKAPEEDVEFDYIQGTYRLFIGNNARNVSSPLKRSRVAPVRQYRDPNWDDRPAEERLRDMIKRKLNSLNGPRLPASFRLFGGKSLSMKFFTVLMPPVNEDTPFKWAREKVTDFKKEHLDDIVDFIIKGLRDGNKENSFGVGLPTDDQDQLKETETDLFSASRAREDANSTRHAHKGIYPNANGSTFDIFHFAVYRKHMTPREVRDKYWNTWMTPIRPFMGLKKTVRIQEDQEVELDLLQLHSVFDDIKLEITQLPELGNIHLYPNKTVLKQANLAGFRELPPGQQQKIYFKPNPRENNNNIKGANSTRRLDPYSVIRYRAWTTTTGRKINSSHEVSIEIWVDPVQRTTAHQVADVDVPDDQPMYLDLRGVVDDVESSNDSNINSTVPASRRLGIFGLLSMLMNTSGIPRNVEPTDFNQTIQILDLPRYGRLYDRRIENTSSRLSGVKNVDLNDLEPYRIRREWIANRTFSTSLIYVHDTHSLETPAGTTDLLRYQVRAAFSAEYSSPSTVKFHLLASIPKSNSEAQAEINTHAPFVSRVEEGSTVTIALSELDAFQLDPSVIFKIKELPRHGKLYQHREDSVATNASDGSLGSLIHSRGTIVEDVRGRVVYAPDPNYFNLPDDNDESMNQTEESLDSFGYTVVTAQDQNDEEGTGQAGQNLSPSEFGLRFVHLQVVNLPGTLAILPPTVFFTNGTREEPIHVPVTFDDPDGYSGPYRVTLTAEDGVSKFEFGHAVTDDDLLKFCPYKRPCNLIRSANESFSSNSNDDKDERLDWQLLYRVKTRAWNPSRIEVEGSKTALDHALQRLVFRDSSGWIWYNEHTARFEVTIERINGTSRGKAKMRYYVEFPPSTTDDNPNSLGQALSNLFDFVSMGLWIALVCFVLTSASCCSMGFCCCCTRARTEKRHQFEEERRRYIEQVAQNDREYSSLLVSLATNLCADHGFVVNLLRSCGDMTRKERTTMQLLCLESLTPILEADNIFIKLVMHLMSVESQRGLKGDTFAYPSLAGLALAHVCCEKSEAWLRNLVRAVLGKDIGQEGCASAQLLTFLEDNLSTVPAEVVDICQKYADFMSTLGVADRLEAIHVVFFNHFIGPSLWFSKELSSGVRLSRPQRRKVRRSLQAFVSFGDARGGEHSFRGDEDFEARYRFLLQSISKSTSNQESRSSKPEEDCDFIGACLMNLHSILEGVLPTLEAEERLRETPEDDMAITILDDEDVSGELDATSVVKIKRLLRALNFPITSCEALIASAGPALSSSPLLRNGFSRDEWRARIRESATKANPLPTHCDKRKPAKLRHGTSLLAVDVAQDEDAEVTAFEASRSCAPGGRDGTGPIQFEF